MHTKAFSLNLTFQISNEHRVRPRAEEDMTVVTRFAAGAFVRQYVPAFYD